jgi:hypothetical protein
VIELWGGVNAPWSPWLLPGQGEYASVGSGLAARNQVPQVVILAAVSFGTCGIDDRTSAEASHLRELVRRGKLVQRNPARSPNDRKFP